MNRNDEQDSPRMEDKKTAVEMTETEIDERSRRKFSGVRSAVVDARHEPSEGKESGRR